jgi:AcrR family transcriptional regulator
VIAAPRVEAPRRAAILDAALIRFLASGVSGTTIDALCRESGASVGSIYHFFGSKERLAVELYLDILGDYLNTYLAALQNSRSARGGVEGSVRSHLRWVAAHEERARYLFNCRESEVLQESRCAVGRLNEQFYEEANGWLRAHIRGGRIRSLPPRLCQALWMGPSVEYARLWLARSGETFNILEGERALAQAAWQAIKGSAI